MVKANSRYKRTDVLVVGGIDPAPPAGGGVVVMIIVMIGVGVVV
jgi:hypothetical protein